MLPDSIRFDEAILMSRKSPSVCVGGHVFRTRLTARSSQRVAVVANSPTWALGPKRDESDEAALEGLLHQAKTKWGPEAADAL